MAHLRSRIAGKGQVFQDKINLHHWKMQAFGLKNGDIQPFWQMP